MTLPTRFTPTRADYVRPDALIQKPLQQITRASRGKTLKWRGCVWTYLRTVKGRRHFRVTTDDYSWEFVVGRNGVRQMRFVKAERKTGHRFGCRDGSAYAHV